ncbi:MULTISPECIES: hypothetical protein [unclassified Microbacterium]|uniref:hypothetical protein n=1 Tax=unclassified Microbacterium TaxID=2609290 RepID=UPI0018DF1DF7
MSAHVRGGEVRSTAGKDSRRPSWRLIWLLPAGFALLAGLDAGLLLLGLPAPITADRLPAVHGMLLVLGFVGTLIALERATALGRWYGYLAPALLGLGGLLLAAPAVPLVVGKSVLAVGAAAFTLVYIPLWRRQHDAAVLTQLLAAGLGLASAVIWTGQDSLTRVLPWLIGFVVLTIAAERVELARITMGAAAGGRLLLHAWVVTGALVIGAVFPDAGSVLLGLALLSLAGWLLMHDVARRTIRASGVTRYMAACILAGYAWLAVAGVALLFGAPAEQRVYDAVVHAVFLGYVFSMIMAHATSILPAVLRIALPYRPAFWVPIALLQIALVVRLWVGDGLGMPAGLQIGGVLGVLALMLFMATALVSAVLGPVPPSSVSETTDRMPAARRVETRPAVGAPNGLSFPTERRGEKS